MPGALGRNKPPDHRHLELYPFDAISTPPKHQPVPLGIDWLEGFDKPVKGIDGKWRLPTKNLGGVRGGHDICARPAPDPAWAGQEQDPLSWWTFFDQGETPACVGFAHARAMSLIYREKFNPFWLYDDARRAEGSYPNGEGSTNRSGCAALLKWGCHFESGEVAKPVPWKANQPGKKITAYHWATNVDQVLSVLGITSGGEIPLLQSWGRFFPHEVWMAPELLADQFTRGAEASVILTA